MRLLRIAVVVLVAVGLLEAGWFGARRFESPAQRAAKARPPAATPIFEPVTAGRLADDVSAQGTVGDADILPLIAEGAPSTAVVTASPLEGGSTVNPGQPVLEVDGDPVFAMPGAFAFYRDLTQGDLGPDVAQLQRGLRAGGQHIPDAEDGRFGPGTARAVRAMYRSAGAEAPTTPAPVVDTTVPPGIAPVATVQPPVPAPLVVVPRTQLALAAELPATVRSALQVGAQVTPGKPIASLGRGDLVVRAPVANSAAVRLAPGMVADLRGPDGLHARGRVVRVDLADASQSDGLAPVVIRTSTPLPRAWSGQPVVANITITVVDALALLVPTRAVVTTAQGTSFVVVRGVHGGRRCSVHVAGSLAGVSAVVPTSGGLRATDQVEVR